MQLEEVSVFDLVSQLTKRISDLRHTVTEEYVLGEIPPASMLFFERTSELVRACQSLQSAFTPESHERFRTALVAMSAYPVPQSSNDGPDDSYDYDSKYDSDDSILDIGEEYVTAMKRYAELQKLYHSRLETTKREVARLKMELESPVPAPSAIEWNCPAQSNECTIRRQCTNKCGRNNQY